MSRKKGGTIAPAISISLILISLFTMVFLQVEVRRMGYLVWRKSRDHKIELDRQRVLATQFARVIRPSHLQEVAVSRLTLSEPKAGQIIHMSGDRLALKQ